MTSITVSVLWRNIKIVSEANKFVFEAENGRFPIDRYESKMKREWHVCLESEKLGLRSNTCESACMKWRKIK